MRIMMRGTRNNLWFLGVENPDVYYSFFVPFLDGERIDLVFEVEDSWPRSRTELSWHRSRDGTGDAWIRVMDERSRTVRQFAEFRVRSSLLPSDVGRVPLPPGTGIEEGLALARDWVWNLNPFLAQIPLFPSKPKALAKRLLNRNPFLLPLKLVEDPEVGLELFPLCLEERWFRDWVRYREWKGNRVVKPVMEALFGKKGLEALEKVQEELWVKKVLES